MTVQFTANDPYYLSMGSWGQGFDDLYGLRTINAETAWDQTQGEGVIVAVIDSGVDYNHEDIAANIWTNPNEIRNNGVDDDGNGFIDDYRGWDFGDEDNDSLIGRSGQDDLFGGDGIDICVPGGDAGDTTDAACEFVS